MIGLIYSRVNIKLRQKTIIPCATNTNKQPQVNKNFISFGIHQQLAKLDMTSFANIIPHLVFSPAVHDLSITLDHSAHFCSSDSLTRLCLLLSTAPRYVLLHARLLLLSCILSLPQDWTTAILSMLVLWLPGLAVS